MPRNYRRYKKKNYGSRYNRVISSARNTAYLARQVIKIKRSMNVEYKFHDVTGTNTVVPDGAGTIVFLSNIDQGLLDTTRVGAQIKATYLEIKYDISAHASSTDSIVRIMLIEDKQTNQAIYAVADLLASVGNILSLVAPKNLDNKFRFRVIRDRRYNFSGTGGKTNISGTFKVKLNSKIRYDNTGNGIADLTSKSFSLLFISNEPTNTPDITFFSRLRYVDN